MSCWVMGLAMGEHVGEGAFLTSLGVFCASNRRLIFLSRFLIH